MVLQSAGPIDASDINTEIGRNMNSELSMNDSIVRMLASKAQGTEISYTNFYEKSASGLAIWAVSMESINNVLASSVDVDSFGNVYLAGIYGTSQVTIYNSRNVDSGLTLRATTRASSYYVVKFNPDGDPQWAVTVDGGLNDCDMAVDSAGNVYLAGTVSASSGCVIYNANNQTQTQVVLSFPTFHQETCLF